MDEKAAKELKKLKKLKKKEKKVKEATEAEAATTVCQEVSHRPRTRSIDLAEAEAATPHRPRTRSMDSSDETAGAVASPRREKKPKKGRMAKRKLREVDEPNDAVAMKKPKVDPTASTKTPTTPTSTPMDDPSVEKPEDFRKKHLIMVKGETDDYKCPAPMTNFDATPFGREIRGALDAAGYTSPTPTQAQSWPIALSGSDIISVARTGSGKTLGFLLPAFHSMLQQKGSRPRLGACPSIVVLAPTRELACQIHDEATKFGKMAGIRSVAVYGGAPKYPQIKAIESGAQVVVATPGRLNDLLTMGKVRLDGVACMCLDEADRMLDMGFEPQIRTIIAETPLKRQTLFFTATWPKEVQRLASEFLRSPVRINIGTAGKLNANKSIKQHIEVVDERDKADKLWELLKNLHQSPPEADHKKTIVFTGKKRICDKLANEAWNRGFAVDSIHGDRDQWERTKVMDQFRSGAVRMLVATDVAARGLDVKDIGVVINYDFPNSGVEDYVHRIGRTARGSATGDAHTFFTRDDSKFAHKLIGVLNGAGQEVPADLQRMDRGGVGGGGAGEGEGEGEGKRARDGEGGRGGEGTEV
ncbi:unnamed protein product, partial [Discosporangium mesarthrocarpum]